MDIPHASTTALPFRMALVSIVSFWAFYFTIWSLRFAIMHHSLAQAMLGTRAIVSLGSAGVTIVFYLLLRRVPLGKLARSITLALILAAPASLLYSAFNWYMFSHLGDGEMMNWHWSPASPKTQPSTPNIPTAAMPVTVGAMPACAESEWTPLQAIADQASNGYFFFIAWAALYLALSYAAEIGALERRAAALRAAAQSAELRALRYQVNPHFLFNTLNSLSSLVLANRREQAEQMIINLANFFRTSLTGEPTEDVPLADEINLQRLYLDIERVRFPDRLLFTVDLPDALASACVPGLILQPLIENAVKHAVARSRRPVTIAICARANAGQLILTVADDGALSHPDPENAGIGNGTGLGLRNVAQRLAARFGTLAACHWAPAPACGFAVTLTLPLLHHAA